MRTFLTLLTLELAVMLSFGIIGIALAQENPPQPPGPNRAGPAIHGLRSIDQELDHLQRI